MLSQGLSSRNTYKREGKPKAESKKFGNRHVIAAIAVAPAATGDSAPFKWEGAQEEQETAAGSHLHNDAAPAAGQRLDATSTDGAAPFAWEVPDDAEVPTNALHDESAPAAGVSKEAIAAKTKISGTVAPPSAVPMAWDTSADDLVPSMNALHDDSAPAAGLTLTPHLSSQPAGSLQWRTSLGPGRDGPPGPPLGRR